MLYLVALAVRLPQVLCVLFWVLCHKSGFLKETQWFVSISALLPCLGVLGLGFLGTDLGMGTCYRSFCLVTKVHVCSGVSSCENSFLVRVVKNIKSTLLGYA